MPDSLTIAPLAKALSLRETVTQILRAAIISGEMAPGEVYSAPALGTRFGVSATPVREAMVDLSREGLVETVPNKGFRVTAVSESDLDDIAALRMLIEPPTVREVTPRIPAEAIPALRELARAIVDNAAAGDLVTYTEADRRFHLAILEYSHNQRLLTLVSDLRSHTRLYGLSGMVDRGTLAASAAEHLELVDLIAGPRCPGRGQPHEAAHRPGPRRVGQAPGMSLPSCDVAVIGAGAVGAACAYFAAVAGHRVTVIDRGAIAAGASSACEGNILVSDKEAGPELDLALYSHQVWRTDLAEHGKLWEFEDKGGLMVTGSERGLAGLHALVESQRALGTTVEEVDAAGLRDLEPHLSPAVTAGAYYPQDAQVQPMLLVAHLLRLARGLGARVLTGTEVTGFLRDGDRVVGVRTSRRRPGGRRRHERGGHVGRRGGRAWRASAFRCCPAAGSCW